MIYKIKFIAQSIQWWSSFPSSLQTFFTVTNSKDCPTIDGEKCSQMQHVELLYLMCLTQCLRCDFYRSTTGGLQIALPTGVSRQACWDKLELSCPSLQSHLWNLQKSSRHVTSRNQGTFSRGRRTWENRVVDNNKMMLHLNDFTPPTHKEIKSSSNSVLRPVGECIHWTFFGLYC